MLSINVHRLGMDVQFEIPKFTYGIMVNSVEDSNGL